MSEDKTNVLYVDDEGVNLLAFKASFRRDYNVYTADSGKKGIDVLEKNDIQVIISDQRMPDMTGVQLLAKVQEEHPEVIRILLTGFAEISAVIDAINLGKVYSYVTKPWNEEELRHVIDSANIVHSLTVQNNEQKEKYNELLHFMPYPVFVMDTKARIIQVNDAAVNKFGYSREEMANHNYMPFFNQDNSFENILKRIRTEGKLSNFEVSVVKKDGTATKYLLHSTPINPNDRIASTYQLIFMPGDN